ncbi:tetratricopeptide repeat protein [Dysgonomonas sp. Marseille-P4361]|uniref:tetratricopeptide repeat protein n=1 Tax=Dysgonomonas sp. Marseille-P4361 TaxID=2161820 RepID=UPI0021007D57|nr:tetratricopeptide repeat protein [Dysgonomonas sp. Marseille-P4361]
MKYFLGSLLSIMISISAIAQNNPGTDYISLGDLKLAKDYFMKRMRQAPAESNYYLGEIAYQEGNLAEAQKNYEAGVAADPASALNNIGLAKLQLKSNPKEAEDQLKDIQKKNKKDVTVILAIAKAYLDNDMKEKTQEKLKDAYKADKKNPYIYIFEADMLAKENKIGEATQLYDQAIYFDPNCTLAYLKGARVYEYINRNHAADMLKKVIAIQPDNKLATRELAGLYYRDGFYPQAIEAYKEYFKTGDYGIEDLRRYAAAEYFTNNFAESMRLLQEGMQNNPDDFVLNRLLMYNSNSTQDYETGLAAGDKFFSLPLNEGDSILALDYKTYANILSQTGNKVKAMEQYKKLADLDPTNAELRKEMATTCASERMYPEAAEFYKKFIELSPEEAIDAQNYFQLGRYYFLGGVAAASDTTTVTPEEAKAKSIELYKKADETFAIVAERVPDSHLGYYQRAQTNYRMDPDSEQGLAKPHYEKTIEVILAKGGDLEAADKAILIEAYSYLSYFYYLEYDKTKKAADKEFVKEYAGKVLELDPENANGKALFEFATN